VDDNTPTQDDNAPAADAISNIPIGDIKIGERRAVDADKVKDIADSMAKIGLGTAITVKKVNGKIFLVAGEHRLQAAISLGWTTIACVFIDPALARLWQISENLHRSDLSALERAEQIAEWIKLTTRASEQVSGQVDRKPGRPKGGNAEAARELTALGDTEEARRKVVERSTNIAAISPAAKEVAEAEGLADNQGALLQIRPDDGDRQGQAHGDGTGQGRDHGPADPGGGVQP